MDVRCWADGALCTRLLYAVYKCICEQNFTCVERERETGIVRLGCLSSMCMGILSRTWADVWPFPFSVGWVWLQEQPQPTCFWCSWLIVLHIVAISLWVAQPMDRSVSFFKKGIGVFQDLGSVGHSAGFWRTCSYVVLHLPCLDFFILAGSSNDWDTHEWWILSIGVVVFQLTTNSALLQSSCLCNGCVCVVFVLLWHSKVLVKI